MQQLTVVCSNCIHVSLFQSIPLSHIHMYTQSYILVRVVDVELLQKQAIIEEAIVHVGQELEDDAFLRSQEDHCVVLMGTRLIVHHDACQTIPGIRGYQVK